MSKVITAKGYVFHTDIGAVVVKVETLANFDVEDVIRGRAIAQARSIQFYNKAQQSSPNDQKAPRTISSAYTVTGEELPT